MPGQIIYEGVKNMGQNDIALPINDYKKLLSQIERYCLESCSFYTNGNCLKDRCPLYNIEKILLEHEQPGTFGSHWYIIKALENDEVLIAKTTYEKAQQISDYFAGTYEVHVPSSWNDIQQILSTKINFND